MTINLCKNVIVIVSSYRTLLYSKNTLIKSNFFVGLANKRFVCAINEPSKINVTSLNTTHSSEEKILLSTGSLLTFFESHPSYSNLVYNTTLECPKSEENYRTLKILSEFYNSPENTVADKLKTVMKEELTKLEFEQLLDLMNLLFKKVKLNSDTNIMLDMFSIIDDELNLRRPTLPANETFKCMYLMRASNFCKNFTFYHIKLKKLVSKVYLLDQQKCFLCIFFLRRKILSNSDKFEFEEILYTFIPHLEPEEMICLSMFYKNQNSVPLKKDFLSKLLNKLYEFMCKPNTIFLGKVLDITLNNTGDREAVCDFLQKFKSLNEDLNPLYWVYYILCQSCFKYTDLSLTQTAMEKIKKNLEFMPFLFIEKLTFSLAQMNYRDDEFLDLAVSKCRPKHLVKFIRDLIFFEKYPEDLIQSVMTEDFFNILKSNSRKTNMKIWSFINRSLAIDCPKLYCDISDKKYIKSENIWFFNEEKYGPGLNFFKFFYKIRNILKERYGEDKTKYIKILPQYFKVVLMKFDRNLQAQPVEDDINDHKKLEDHFYIVVFPASLRFCGLDETLNLIGQTICRHFAANGYNCVPVILSKFKYFKKLNQESIFVEDLIKNKLQELSAKKEQKSNVQNCQMQSLST